MLTISGLSIAYGTRQVLGNVSFVVNPGEVVALIGPNGAGKSTLIRGISGIIPIRAGKVQFQQQDIARLDPRERARLMAVVPQASQLGGAFTVEQVVMMGRSPHMSWIGRPGETDRRLVTQAMAQTQITELAERKIAELSGGEQQRVLLARALAQDTPLLLLDEPTTHLDLQYQAGLLALVRRLAVDKHIAVLMALHDLNMVAQYADRAALLMEGSVLAFGSPREVLTVDLIAQAYRAQVEIIHHPRTDTPIILHAENTENSAE